jgi:hypothetical protein
MNSAQFEIVTDESTDSTLVIRDIGHKRFKSVTNDAEHVVQKLMDLGMLWRDPVPRRLKYYDSQNNLDEIKYDEHGFIGFAPGKLRG